MWIDKCVICFMGFYGISFFIKLRPIAAGLRYQFIVFIQDTEKAAKTGYIKKITYNLCIQGT